MADIIGYGCVLEYGTAPNTSTSSWTPIAGIIDMTPPAPKAADVKTSALDNTTANHTYIPGMIEPGEMKLKIKYDKTASDTLYGLLRTTKAFRVKFSDG